MNLAQAELIAAWGDAPAPVACGWSPGRATIVGEHVDYVGGSIVAIALDIGISVAVRRSRDAVFRVSSGGIGIERQELMPAGDIGDRVLGALEALRRDGVGIDPLEIGVAATLPPSAGLSSSAAVAVATIVAALRHRGLTIAAARLVDVALAAERDVAGVPCGILDPTTVVHAPEHGALLIDAASGTTTILPWPWADVALVACATRDAHDVGGAEYRTRRREAAAIMAVWDVASVHGLDEGHVDMISSTLRPRARHLMSESRRADAAGAALRAGDAAALGALMNASHDSLRDDYAVSTAGLDATVRAAREIPGVLGARLVGAGFGGTVIALTDVKAVKEARAAMARAADVTVRSSTWVMTPGPGVAVLCPDVVAGGSPD